MPQYINDPTTRSRRLMVLALARQALSGLGWKVTDPYPLEDSAAFSAKSPEGDLYLFAFKLRNNSSDRYKDTPIDTAKWWKLNYLCYRAHQATEREVSPAFLVGYADGKFRLFRGYKDMRLFGGTTARVDRGDPEDIDETYNIPHGRLFPIIN